MTTTSNGGDVNIQSGYSSRQTSGAINILTPTSGSSGGSGPITLSTSTAFRNSGKISVGTGLSQSGDSGVITLSTGNETSDPNFNFF
jgi:hypothetical protein